MIMTFMIPDIGIQYSIYTDLWKVHNNPSPSNNYYILYWVYLSDAV